MNMHGEDVYAHQLERVAQQRGITLDHSNVEANLALLAGEQLGKRFVAAQTSAARWRAATLVCGVLALVGWVRSFWPEQAKPRATPRPTRA